MLAAVNPCGVLLMPSLVAYYLGSAGVAQDDWVTRAWRASLFGLMATLGFVVFAGAFADDPGESLWAVRLVGVVGVVFFGWAASCDWFQALG